MVDTDEMFENELRDCLKIAKSLIDAPSSDAKTFARNQLKELQDFLQMKQQQEEQRLDDRIKTEQKELNDLRKRIDEMSAAGDHAGSAQSSSDHNDFLSIWEDLKTNEGQQLFDHLKHETAENLPSILEYMIGILKTVYGISQKKSQAELDEICFQVKYPGENRADNSKLKIEPAELKELRTMCRPCQKKTTPFCLPSVKQIIIQENEIKKLRDKYKASSTTDYVDKYIAKSVEFSWTAATEDPELEFITNPANECKKMIELFEDRKSVGKECYVQWPALVKGSQILSKWELYWKSHDDLVTDNQPNSMDGKTSSRDPRIETKEGPTNAMPSHTTRQSKPNDEEGRLFVPPGARGQGENPPTGRKATGTQGNTKTNVTAKQQTNTTAKTKTSGADKNKSTNVAKTPSTTASSGPNRGAHNPATRNASQTKPGAVKNKPPQNSRQKDGKRGKIGHENINF